MRASVEKICELLGEENAYLFTLRAAKDMKKRGVMGKNERVTRRSFKSKLKKLVDDCNGNLQVAFMGSFVWREAPEGLKFWKDILLRHI